MKYPLISTPIPYGINIAHRVHSPTAQFDACGISRNGLRESLRNAETIAHELGDIFNIKNTIFKKSEILKNERERRYSDRNYVIVNGDADGRKINFRKFTDLCENIARLSETEIQ